MAVLHVIFLLFTNYILIIQGSYHWVVTENGKIQSQTESSGFPLKKPDDLMLLLEQEQRISAITETYKELVLFKKLIDNHWAKIEEKEDLENSLYSSDINYILGAEPLTQCDLSTDYMDYGQGSRPKMKPEISLFEPDSSVEFSLMTLNSRDNLIVNPVPSEATIYFNINEMLKKNKYNWTAHNVASLYWRMMGNGTNVLEYAKRAIYFSPRHKRYIVLLHLGALFQELENLAEAAVVLHNAVDHDPLQHISYLTALVDYARSLACYDNVLKLYPEHEKAMQLKHAIFCHKKLKANLLEIHLSLQNAIQDLKKYYEIKEKWLLLQNQLNWDKDNGIRDSYIFPQSVYINLLSLHSSIEQKIKSLMKNVNRNLWDTPNVKRDNSKNLESCDCENEDGPICRYQSGNLKISCSEEERRYYKSRKKEDCEIQFFDSFGYRLRSKMNSLIASIKLMNQDSNINVVDSKRQIHQQINFLKTVNNESQFSENPMTFLNNECLNIHNEFRKLSECFVNALDLYSVNVNNKITKLKEKMKLMNKSPATDRWNIITSRMNSL